METQKTKISIIWTFIKFSRYYFVWKYHYYFVWKYQTPVLRCKNSGPSKYLLHIYAFSCNTCYETPSLHWKTCLDHCGPLGMLGDKCCLTDHTYTHGLYVWIKAIHKVCFYINTLYFTIYYNILMWQNGKRNNDWEWTAFLNSWFVVVHSFN